MSISNEELDRIWGKALDADNELVLRLVSEIARLRIDNGNLVSGRVSFKRKTAANTHKTGVTCLRRGQEYMRDRIVLTLMNGGKMEAAVLANNHDIKKEGTWEDLQEEHHANAAEMQRRRHVINDAWSRLFGEGL
jgi:hypothetical protein